MEVDLSMLEKNENTSTAGIVSNGFIHVPGWHPTLVALSGGSPSDTEPLGGNDQWKSIIL